MFNILNKIFLLVICALNFTRCSKLGVRITNGQAAEEGQIPHQVGLLIKTNLGKNVFCGGSYIGNNCVLTAKHCTRNAISVTVYIGSILFKGGTTVAVSSNNIINHYGDGIQNDIAIIRLPTLNGAKVKEIKLSPDVEYENQIATASGWGRISDNSQKTSQYLQFVQMSVINNKLCKQHYDSYISDGNICTSTIGGFSVCNGDSGGPLEAKGLLIGVASFVSGDGCQSNKPAAFTRISKYLDWIKQNTGITP